VPVDVAAALADRRRYERQIERLHQRHLRSGRLYEIRQDDVALASVVLHRGRVARLLARDVARGRYTLEPGELRTIRVRDKLREVYTCRLTDLIVHGVVAEVVREATASAVPDRVYSYRPGTTWATPVRRFAAWLRAGRRAEPDPRRRGAYVLRGDVDAYTDSIPLGPDSPLWAMLAHHLGPLHPVVRDVVHTLLRTPEGVVRRARGLPMGQPIAPVLANLYLAPLDAVLAGPSDGFSARYGDDFLFAHPDPDVLSAVLRQGQDVLDGLGLTVNERKRRIVYLTAAGRPAPPGVAAAGAPDVTFLGARIRADGTVGLDRPKVAALLRDVDRRSAATVATVAPAPRAVVGRAVCAAVNSALRPRTGIAEQRSANLLRAVVTDRAQLRQLDARIAVIVAAAVTGRAGPRAFREVPYRTLRQEWGLRSLVAARNDHANGRGYGRGRG
jgi:hypothetical protein